MKAIKYGITVTLLKENDLELVRNWRNNPLVVQNYEFRDYITAEMQKEWFSTINNIHNLYTIFEYRGEKVGVINLKNIDWEKREFEGGIFIADPKFHKTALPAILSYMTTEIQFFLFGWERGYARVLRENTATQKFIAGLGYELCPGQEEENNQRWFVTREHFYRKTAKLKKAILLMEQDPAMRFIVEKEDFNNPVVLQWEEVVRKNLTPDRVEETAEGRVYFFS
ncbi:MAG TPA: GNAT family N-acetyltransferase [Bacteroidales bacterium]|nr:GNAT family N-acetyltransferase [Bacteroidales bacterium]